MLLLYQNLYKAQFIGLFTEFTVRIFAVRMAILPDSTGSIVAAALPCLPYQIAGKAQPIAMRILRIPIWLRESGDNASRSSGRTICHGAVRKMPIKDEMISALRQLFRVSGSNSATNDEQASSDAAPAPDLTADLLIDERVPKNCREKASALVSAIDLVIGRLASDNFFDERAAELGRLRSVHLPQLLRRYVDIPPEHRAEIFRKTEKSASYHLAAALDVMAKRVAELSLELSAGVLDEFTIGARFVETRYGHQDDPFA